MHPEIPRDFAYKICYALWHINKWELAYEFFDSGQGVLISRALVELTRYLLVTWIWELNLHFYLDLSLESNLPYQLNGWISSLYLVQISLFNRISLFS